MKILIATVLMTFGLALLADEKVPVTNVEGDVAEAAAEVHGELGSKTNPVRCDMPRGQRAYLRRLRDAANSAPTFQRIGSFGQGPYGNILDGYELTFGDEKVVVFLDMYHPGIAETNAIPGFSLVKE